jgi:hypothetical protein
MYVLEPQFGYHNFLSRLCCECTGNSCAIHLIFPRSPLITQNTLLPHIYPHSMLTFTHYPTTLPHRYDGQHHSERHPHISRCHTHRSSDSAPIGVHRMLRRITTITPVEAHHYWSIATLRNLIISVRQHSRREQIRCRASDRYIFFSNNSFTVLILCIEPWAL